MKRRNDDTRNGCTLPQPRHSERPLGAKACPRLRSRDLFVRSINLRKRPVAYRSSNNSRLGPGGYQVFFTSCRTFASSSLSLSLSRESRMDGCPYDFEGDSEVAVYDHVPHARHFPLRDVRMCRTGFLIDLLNRLTDNTERPLDGVRGLLISFKLFEGHICNKSGGGIHGLYHISDISFLVASQRYSTSPRIFADTS